MQPRPTIGYRLLIPTNPALCEAQKVVFMPMPCGGAAGLIPLYAHLATHPPARGALAWRADGLIGPLPRANPDEIPSPCATLRDRAPTPRRDYHHRHPE